MISLWPYFSSVSLSAKLSSRLLNKEICTKYYAYKEDLQFFLHVIDTGHIIDHQLQQILKGPNSGKISFSKYYNCHMLLWSLRKRMKTSDWLLVSVPGTTNPGLHITEEVSQTNWCLYKVMDMVITHGIFTAQLRWGLYISKTYQSITHVVFI